MSLWDRKLVRQTSPSTILIREALHCYASESISQLILHRSLALASMAEVPSGGRTLRSFLENHLHQAVMEKLGEDMADGVQQMLSPLAAQIASEIPLMTPPPSGSAAPTPLREGPFTRATEIPGQFASVLVAGLNASRISVLESYLPDTRLSSVRDIVALLDIVQANPALLPIVVLDCTAPAFHMATLVSAAPEMSPGSRFLLWDASPSDVLFGDRGSDWVRCELGTPILDVAQTIMRLVSNTAH